MPEKTTNAFLYRLEGKESDDISYMIMNKDISPDELKRIKAERIMGYYNVSLTVFERMKKFCNEFRGEGTREEKESEILRLLDIEIEDALLTK